MSITTTRSSAPSWHVVDRIAPVRNAPAAEVIDVDVLWEDRSEDPDADQGSAFRFGAIPYRAPLTTGPADVASRYQQAAGNRPLPGSFVSQLA
jgi:hypothetical protein